MTSATGARVALMLAVVGGTLLLVAEPALGLAVLAGTGAGVLLRPGARAAMAALVLLVGAGALVLGWQRQDALLTVGGCLVAAAAAAVTVLAGRLPPPHRRERVSEDSESPSRDSWAALDRGEDPTT